MDDLNAHVGPQVNVYNFNHFQQSSLSGDLDEVL